MAALTSKTHDTKNCQGCITLAQLGGLLCALHKKTQPIDEKKICTVAECKGVRKYGPLFGDLLRCQRHRTFNDFRHNNPVCPCGARPEWGLTNYPSRCNVCKNPDDKPIALRPCARCGIDQYLAPDGRCDDCVHAADHQSTDGHRAQVVKALQEAKLEMKTDCKTHVVLVKICVNQHRQYDLACEIGRLRHEAKNYKDKKVCFIRYNPSEYDGKTAQKDRLARLVSVVRTLVGWNPTSPVMDIKLYYDGDTGKNNIAKL